MINLFGPAVLNDRFAWGEVSVMTTHSHFHPHLPHVVPRFRTWSWSEQELAGLLTTLAILLVLLLMS